MNTIHMPGFNAEASLYTTKERYRGAYFSASVADSDKVLPQFCTTNDAGVTTCCDCFAELGGFCFCHHLLVAASPIGTPLRW
jgi:hypothetical protein